jgi:intracellular multiplication protein IcmP
MAGSQQQQGGGGGGGGNTDNAMAPIWIMALLVFVCVGLWYWAHAEIVAFIFRLDEIQARMILNFVDSPKLERLVFILQTVDPKQIQWNDLSNMTEFVGLYTRYPVMLLLLILAGWLYYIDVPMKFRKTYSMKTLSFQEQVNWSAIMPVVREDLVKADIDIGPWAMALLPMEFAKKFDLLKKDDVVIDKMMPGMEMTAGVRRGDAKRIFTLQLGPYWEGIDRCQPHVLALAAVFLARVNRDRNAAKKILDGLNKSFSDHKINYSIAKQTLQKYKNTPIAQEIFDAHGYVLTVMASLLVEARKDGVLASAEFLWLKVVDRRLWYMLNCVGRQTPYSEIGGPFSHWLAEKAMKRRSRVPMIDEAIKGLEAAIKGVKLTPKQMQELKP